MNSKNRLFIFRFYISDRLGQKASQDSFEDKEYDRKKTNRSAN